MSNRPTRHPSQWQVGAESSPDMDLALGSRRPAVLGDGEQAGMDENHTIGHH